MTARRASGVLRVLSSALFLVSLLTIFRAPIHFLWFPAIAVTEWFHVGMVLAIGLFVISRKLDAEDPLAPLLAVGTLVLLLTPWLRATFVAQGLSAELRSAFRRIQAESSSLPSKPLRLETLFLGQTYGPITKQRYQFPTEGQMLDMDLYLGLAQGRARPIVLVVHGGAWRGGDREELPALNRFLAAKGYAVASIDYRLAPLAPFPAARDDVFAAIRYLKANALKLRIDPSRVVVLGRSAGGQIALSAAYAGREPAICGVIAFYAPNDLTLGYTKPGNPLILDSKKVISQYLGGTPDSNPKVYHDASPLEWAGPVSPPTLLIHGGRDEFVWPLHSERLSARLAATGRPVYYLNLPWATHGCDANLVGPCGQLSTYAIEYFLAYAFERSAL